MTRTQTEITDIETKANTLLELGEVQKPVEDYIELLQETIVTYQGELFSKNSEVSKLEFKVSKLEREIEKLKSKSE
jgi:peptidoglycan hydrolase CwlO-like protein